MTREASCGMFLKKDELIQYEQLNTGPCFKYYYGPGKTILQCFLPEILIRISGSLTQESMDVNNNNNSKYSYSAF